MALRKFILAGTLASAGLALSQAADVFIPPDFTLDSDQGNAVYLEGLIEGFLSGSDNEAGVNPGNSSPELTLRMGQSTATGPDAWTAERTWVYTGQIFTGASGTLSFAVHNDDNDWLKVNGNVVLNDNGWDTAKAGVLSLAPNTWVDFEYRVGNGGGGAGPSGGATQGGGSNWNGTTGFVMSYNDEAGSLNANDYIGGPNDLGKPTEISNGTPELFRYQNGFGFTDNIRVTASGTITINGSNAVVAEPSLSFENSAVATLTVNDGSGAHKTLSFTNGTTIATSQPIEIGGSSDVRLGRIVDGANTTTLTHIGSGQLIFDDVSGTSDLSGTTIRSGAGGRVVVRGSGGVNPVASSTAPLTFSGTGGVIDLGGSGSAVTFDNSIAVEESGTLVHSTSTTDIIGSAGKSVSIADGKTLTVNNTGASLRVVSAVNGMNGTLANVGANVVTLSGAVSVGTLQNSGGLLNLTGAMNTITNLNASAGRTEITGGLTLTNNPTIASGATLALRNVAGATLPAGLSVPSGTLEVEAGSLGASSQGVNLTGGTLAIVGNVPGLTAFIYGGDENGANANFGALGTYLNYFAGRGGIVGTGGLEVLTTTTAGGTQTLTFNASEAQYSALGSNRLNNIVSRFTGKIDAPADGVYNFGTTSDDGSVIYVDGQKVVDNNFFQGATRREGNINLTAGSHTIEIGFYEGTGGNSFTADWTTPGGTRTDIPNAALNSGGGLNFNNPITISQDSTLTVAGPTAARSVASSITVNAGRTLTTTGGELTATALNINTGTINASNIVVVNQIVDGGSAVNITKTGPGVLALDPTVAHLQNGGTITVQQGQLGLLLGGSFAPLGNASVTFDGGGLALSSKGGDQSLALPVFNGNGSVTARQIGSGVAGPVNINLTGNLGVASGQTITLAAQNDYTLRLGGSATGTGTDGSGQVSIAGGNVVTTSNTALQGLAVALTPASGTATLRMETNAPTIGSLSQTASGAVVVGNGSGPATLTLTGGGSGLATYNGSIAAASGSTLQIIKSGTGTQRLQGALSTAGVTVSGGTLQLSSVSAGSLPITVSGGTLQFADPGLGLKVYDADPNASGAYDGSQNTLAGVLAHYAGLGTPIVDTNTAANNNASINYIDPTPPVNVAALDGAPFRVHGSTDQDTIEALMTGRFFAPTAGSYTFHPRSDDGSMVYIDGNLLVNNNRGQGYNENQSQFDRSVTLTAGFHDVAILFNEGAGGAGLTVEVTAPSQARRLLSNSELFRTDLTIGNAINVTNSGTISALGSTLTLSTAPSISSGATATFTAGTVNLAAGATGAGTLRASGATVNANGAVTVGAVVVDNGGTLRANSTLAATGGTTVNEASTLQVTGNSVTGGLTLNGGVLHAVSGTNDFGTAAITGSALSSSGITANALQGQLFLRTGLGIENTAGVFALQRATPDAAATLVSALNFGPNGQADAAFSDFFGVASIANPPDGAFTAVFTGRYTANGVGLGEHSFGTSMNDDQAVLWVDLNQNGIFEEAGSAGNELLSNQPCCGGNSNAAVNLIGGQSYNVLVAVQDTGGGSSLEGHFTPAGGTSATIDPSAQPGTFSSGAFTGGANLRIDAGATVKAGSLVNGRTLAFGGDNAALELASPAATTSTVESILNNDAPNSTLTLGANNTLTVARLTLSQNSTFIKAGAGLLTATAQSLGNNSTLRINGGTVRLSGVQSAGIAGANNGSVEVNTSGTLDIRGAITGAVSLNGGKLMGTGSVGAVTAAAGGGIIAPGTSPGTMTVASIAANGATTFQMEIGSGAAGTAYDQIIVTGNQLDLNSAALSLTVASALQANDILTLILNNGSDLDPGVFAGLANEALINLPAGYQVKISYFDDASTPSILETSGGNDVSLFVTIPEPSTAAILLGGMAMLTGLQRFRRRLT